MYGFCGKVKYFLADLKNLQGPVLRRGELLKILGLGGSEQALTSKALDLSAAKFASLNINHSDAILTRYCNWSKMRLTCSLMPK